MRILGICGGNGVLLYPMKNYLSGNVEPRAAFKTPKNIQWELNFNSIPLYTSAEDMTRVSKADVIVGAPNCGHSSMLAYSRAKQLGDPLKDPSLELYMVALQYYKPNIFMMENLPKMLDMIPESVWKDTLPDYELIFHKESVSKWGNSQVTRKRLVIIGLKRSFFGHLLNKVQYHFSYIHGVNSIKTSGELIANCKGLSGNIREPLDDKITLYAGHRDTLRNIRNFWLHNPKLKRYPVYDRNFSTVPGVYRNLKEETPSTARKANRQFSHLGLQMSPRELARIQGVPDSFDIYENNDELIYTINKGRTTVTKCPPYEIGIWFYKQLIKSYNEIT